MANALILMTALVPTKGHKALIDFALNLVGTRGYVDVIVSGRSFEPVSIDERILALEDHYKLVPNIYFSQHFDDDAPQNPVTDEEWNYWKSLCKKKTGDIEIDYVIASEPYGKKMADLLDAEFIPFDIDRNILSVKGTDVRQNLLEKWDQLLPEFAIHRTFRVCIFGQESTGKTTMAKLLHKKLPSHMTHEFARPYLELMDDNTITDEKMAIITEGQYALQRTVYGLGDKPFIIEDTDLLSTIGYYKIYGGKIHPKIHEWFKETKADLYIVMNDEIPFEEDPLRYGGHERESTKAFWIDLLERHNCSYYEVISTDKKEQLTEILELTLQCFYDTIKPIVEFERD